MALHMYCTRHCSALRAVDDSLHAHDGCDGHVHCIVAELPSLPIATPTLSPSYARPYAQGRDLPPPAQVLPMDLATAPSPKNKAIQLKELPSHRAIARYLHGPAGPLKVVGGAAAQFPGLLGLALRAHRPCCRALGTSRTGRKAAQGPKGRSGGCGREPRLEVAGFRK